MGPTDSALPCSGTAFHHRVSFALTTFGSFVDINVLYVLIAAGCECHHAQAIHDEPASLLKLGMQAAAED